MWRTFWLIPLIPSLFVAEITAAEDALWGISADDIPVVTKGVFAEGVELSGWASLDGRGCLLVSNETRCVEIGYLSASPWSLTAGPEIPLNPPGGPDECDFEAVAADPVTGNFYVLGSHAVAKKKGKPRLEQQCLFRLPTDPKTKLPDAAKASEFKSVSLTPWLARVPEIAASIGQPLQRNGLNLEGLACREGILFIGCRAPHVAGRTPVLEVAADTLYSLAVEKWPAPKVHWLALGKGIGVRDLTATKEGILILAGEAGSVPSETFLRSDNYTTDDNFTLYFWRPQDVSPPVRVGNLPIVKGKAEGILVHEETDSTITIVVLYDGSYNGMPRVFKLNKPRRA